jgi:hypothetical protein
LIGQPFTKPCCLPGVIFLQVPGKMSDPLASPSLPSDGSVGEVVTQSEKHLLLVFDGIRMYLFVLFPF